MAIDQESTPDASDLKILRRSAIENEIPTYRAVSTRAVFAVLCGLLAGLSFTHPAFYLFAVAAVGLGLSADRAIRKHPDMLTGAGLARAGAAMGLVFGLSIFTVMTVQNFLATRQAGAFAADYAQMLKTRPLADLYWIQLNPLARASVTPDENLKQMQGQQEAAMADMKYAGLKQLVQDLRASDANAITFHGIEELGKDDLTLVALARFDVHLAQPPHEHKEGEEHKDGEAHEGPKDLHAMALLKGIVPDGKNAYEWWIEEVTYPYVPKTAALPETKHADDDGHGHSH